MLLPRLSEADPLASSEGSIDPLGMYAIADTLAMRLVPGVRERMQRPRFVTAMAVSAAICRDFGEDVLAADRVSEPWQVLEWHLVEGLVRTCNDREAIRALPGSDKAVASERGSGRCPGRRGAGSSSTRRPGGPRRGTRECVRKGRPGQGFSG